MDPSSAPRSADLPQRFTRRQAISAGLSDRQLRGLVEEGAVQRTRRGMYVATVIPAVDQRRNAHLAAVRAELSARGPGYAASHLSAAAVLRLPLPLGAEHDVHLTAIEASQRSRSAPGVTVHHCDSVGTPTVVVAGIRITTAVRTVADCLRCFPSRVSVPVADAAIRTASVRVDDVAGLLLAQQLWRGGPRAAASLALVDGRRESWLESFAFVCLADWGVVAPEPQVVVLDEVGRFVARCDGGWLDDATVLELDGQAKYLQPTSHGVDPWAAFGQEKERSDSLGNLGLEQVRFGTGHFLRGPQGVVEVIARRRAAGSRSRFTGSFRLTAKSGHTLLTPGGR